MNKRKKNIILLISIIAMAIIWGVIYWYLVVPVIDPRFK